MKILRNSVLILVLILMGTGTIVLVERLFSSVRGLEKNYTILGIETVENLKTDYFLNEKLALENVKLSLLTDTGICKQVDIEPSYISGFDSSQVGSFQMKISYQDFDFETDYDVRYKSMEFDEDYVFSFEQGESVDLTKYTVNILDCDNEIVKQKTLAELNVQNFYTDTITKENGALVRTASVAFYNVELNFDYDVFYFASKGNYIGKSSARDVCCFEVIEFLPDYLGKIKIAKRIAENNLIETIYDFDLKRVDSQTFSTFLTNKAIARLDFATKRLTILKDVVGNDNEIVIQLEKQEKIDFKEPTISGITGVKNLKSRYYVDEPVDLNNVKITLLLSDKTEREVDIGEENVVGLTVHNVGKYSLDVNYYKFNFSFNYVVEYKSIEFYDENINQPFVFEVGSMDVLKLSLVCFDFYDNPVGFRSIGDEDVVLLNFDVSTKTYSWEKRRAMLVCNGAKLEFDYIVV